MDLFNFPLTEGGGQAFAAPGHLSFSFLTPGSAQRADAELFIDRDLSWLRFNRRVLAEAEDKRNPLLERLRFLIIASSNLDEFFMTRVTKRPRHAGRNGAPGDSVAAEICAGIDDLYHTVNRCLIEEIVPELARFGIELRSCGGVCTADSYFAESIQPELAQHLLSAPGEFATLNCGLCLELSADGGRVREYRFIPLPRKLVRCVPVDVDGKHCFVSGLELIKAHAAMFVPAGSALLSTTAFRLTRSANLAADSVHRAAELHRQNEMLVARRMRAKVHGEVVRIEIERGAGAEISQAIARAFGASEREIVYQSPVLDFSSLKPICNLAIPKLRFSPWEPAVPNWIANCGGKKLFARIRRSDQLLHHPYDSFDSSVVRFVREAVEDDRVQSIEMTLYRTGDDSPFVPLLIEAAQRGKRAACLIECKARFEELRNAHWSRKLAAAGVTVLRGPRHLKTHSKAILIGREERSGLRYYAHVATGNYHAETAKLYTDVGLFTCDPQITRELVDYFRFLETGESTGGRSPAPFSKLLVAPFNMRERFYELIEREIQFSKQGKPAHIIAKINNLQDREICRALYRASANGVKVDLIVRGICVLRPGVPGVSENIRVLSIVGRLLEHSRIFYFRRGKADPIAGDFFLGSADWMTRNLDYRAEVVIPVEDWLCRERCWEILQINLHDHFQGWAMNQLGAYQRRDFSPQTHHGGTHSALMSLTSQRKNLG